MKTLLMHLLSGLVLWRLCLVFVKHACWKNIKLPTSSTCMNLLKLPAYCFKTLTKEQLLYIIESNTVLFFYQMRILCKLQKAFYMFLFLLNYFPPDNFNVPYSSLKLGRGFSSNYFSDVTLLFEEGNKAMYWVGKDSITKKADQLQWIIR